MNLSSPSLSWATRALRGLMMFSLLTLPLSSAHAASYTVSSNASSGPNTLNEAIAAANANPGADTIVFSSSVSEIELTSPLPTISDNLNIRDFERNILVRRSQDASQFRIFTVAEGAELLLTNLTLSGGKVAGFGGAINNSGDLVLNLCTLSNNTARSGGAISNFGGRVAVRFSRLEINTAANDASGGAIINSDGNGRTGDLSVFDSTFTGNVGGSGGAIANEGQLFVLQSTFSANQANAPAGSAVTGGGAISSDDNANISTSTFSNNLSLRYGGALFTTSTFKLFSCTVAYNRAAQGGGGLYNAGNSTAIGNTLFAKGTEGSNVANAGSFQFQSHGFNLSDDLTGPNNGTTDRISTATGLDPRGLRKNQGANPNLSTQTIALTLDSAAIDQGNGASISDDGSIYTTRIDQRMAQAFDRAGVPNASGGNGSDIGAFENTAPEIPQKTLFLRVGRPSSFSFPASDQQGSISYTLESGSSLPPGISLATDGTLSGTPTTLTRGSVTTIRATSYYGDSSTVTLTFVVQETGSLVVDTNEESDSFDGKTSLSNAIELANEDPDASEISFNLAADNRTLMLTQSLPNLASNLSIVGPTAAPGIRIMRSSTQGTPAFRIFLTMSGTINLANLTIEGGSATYGAGVQNRAADLTMTACTITGNKGQFGGGLYNQSTSRLRNCTIVGNSVVTNTSALSLGGGICHEGSLLVLDSCTIVGNRAPAGPSAGVVIGNGSTEVGNCIIAGNLLGDSGSESDIDVLFYGKSPEKLVSKGFNLLGDTFGTIAGAPLSNIFNAQGDQIDVADSELKLGSLASNGGPTPTMALLVGSPAVGRGNTSLTTDQRGVARPQGGATDKGAFELEIDSIAPTVAISTPGEGQVLSVSAFNAITGTASDNSRVSLVRLSLSRVRNNTRQYWNGTSFSSEPSTFSTTSSTFSASATTNRTWGYSVPPALKSALDEGTYTASATAIDEAGHESLVVERNFTLTPADPEISVSDVNLSEGNSGTKNASFAVTLNKASTKTITVKVATVGDTATAGSDFTALATTALTFAPGDTSKTVNISIAGDTAIEADELFFVKLGSATNATIADNTGQGKILDDDTARTILVTDATVTEAGTAAFAIKLSGPSGNTITVKAATANNTAIAGVDYTAVAATVLTFAPGETSKTFNVVTSADSSDEPTETFFVKLGSATGATISDNTGLGNIRDDDAPPAFSVTNSIVTEGGTASFTIKLSVASSFITSVKWATANNTATAGSDYTAVAGTVLTFAAGETSQTVTVSTLGDTVAEDEETFLVKLGSATNATISDNTGVGKITNSGGLAAASATRDPSGSANSF